MSSKNCRPNKDDWRNSTEPYAVELSRGSYILTEWDVNCHIDSDTFAYKHWPAPELVLLLQQDNRLELSNSSDGVRYILTIRMECDQLHVSCNCNRKVERLCHHVYYALLHIINHFGTHYFQSKL